VAIFFMGRCSVGKQEITTIERVDTVVVEKPMPYKVEVVRKVSVPVYVPTPADTVVENKESAEENARKDSTLVEVPVEVERREYKSEEYRAVVSGAKIGDLRPTLESMEVYARNEVQVVEQKVPWIRPYISASVGREMMGIGGGISIKDRVDVGAKYMRVGSTDAVMFEASYRFDIKTK
jgi:hypothetical protein